MSEQKPNAELPEITTPAPENAAQPKQRKSTLPDWKPLGVVRDSFYEQMKQDQRY